MSVAPDPAAAPGSPPAGEGRRARLRRETLTELSRAALDEVREHGAAELSLRRVARRMDMSPAGLYRYVDSREDLLTRLIAEAYDDLADHLEAATGVPLRGDRDRPDPRPPMVAGHDEDVADRLRAAALAYRAWAVEHPQEFGLLYGDPIPGYAAPPGGVTVAAMRRVGAGLGRPLIEAWRAGRLRPSVAVEVDEELRGRLAPLAEVVAELAGEPDGGHDGDPDGGRDSGHGGGTGDGASAPPALGLTLLTAWGRLHGQVSLEVFGHHAWLFPDGCEPLYRADLEAMLVDLGVVAGAG